MMLLSKGMLVAAVALAGITVQSVGASAMPIDVAPAAVAQSAGGAGLQEAYWHGGWHRHVVYHRERHWHRHFHERRHGHRY